MAPPPIDPRNQAITSAAFHRRDLSTSSGPILSQLTEKKTSEIGALFLNFIEFQSQLEKLTEELEKLSLEDTPNEKAIEAMEKEYERIEKESKKILRQIEVLERELLEACQQSFLPNHIVLKRLPYTFSDTRFHQLAIENPSFYIEMLKTKLANIIRFYSQVFERAKRHEGMLLNDFFQLSDQPCSLTIEDLGDETHHGGESTLLLTITPLDSSQSYKVVYKPRLAETEFAIIELFKRLNTLGKSPYLLPVYKILPCEGGYSFWEYISGEPLVDDAVTHIQKVESQDRAREALHFLHTICKRIGVTDLHCQNILFDRRTTQWIPIDMEVIKPGHNTGLYGHGAEPALQELDPAIVDQLEQFNRDQQTRLFRVTPLATAVLNQAFLSRDVRRLLTELKQALANDYELTKDDHFLEQTLATDLKQGDVPIWMQKGERLYYGNVLAPEMCIGILKKREEDL